MDPLGVSIWEECGPLSIRCRRKARDDSRLHCACSLVAASMCASSPGLGYDILYRNKIQLQMCHRLPARQDLCFPRALQGPIGIQEGIRSKTEAAKSTRNPTICAIDSAAALHPSWTLSTLQRDICAPTPVGSTYIMARADAGGLPRNSTR